MDEAGLGLLIELPRGQVGLNMAPTPILREKTVSRRKEELGAPAQPPFLQSENCLPLAWGIVLGVVLGVLAAGGAPYI